MTCITYTAPIFGPIHSRRLGISLGINLMPADGKVCTFDCIYCECGLNADNRPTLPRPTRQEVAIALENKLKEMAASNELPDVLTFAGNGEPTSHPDFLPIIQDTIALRDRYCPQAKVSVLSNATLCHRPTVHDALMLVDNNILKLDTIDVDFIHKVDQPVGSYDVDKIVEAMRSFNGKCIIQTMFLTGIHDNTTDSYVKPWIEAVKTIAPQQVMIYTIDRATPVSGIEKASRQRLDEIKQMVEEAGFACSASY